MISTTQYLHGRFIRPALHPLRQAISQWPVESQQRARRNAMLACTDLAQTRAVREDVEEYLAEHLVRHHAAEIDHPDQTDRTAQG